MRLRGYGIPEVGRDRLMNRINEGSCVGCDSVGRGRAPPLGTLGVLGCWVWGMGVIVGGEGWSQAGRSLGFVG